MHPMPVMILKLDKSHDYVFGKTGFLFRSSRKRSLRIVSGYSESLLAVGLPPACRIRLA